ncbi:MAG: hypothetical protein SGPRY_002935 [Prymnesium sp.]
MPLSLLLALPLASARVESSTGLSFSDRRNGQSLVGLGVRKKGPIKASSSHTPPSARSPRSISPSPAPRPPFTPPGTICFARTHLSGLWSGHACVDGAFSKTLVLKMKYGVSKEKMAGAIADSVKPRMTGDTSAVGKLEESLLTGCEKYAEGGRAGPGTEFCFAIRGSTMGVACARMCVRCTPEKTCAL